MLGEHRDCEVFIGRAVYDRSENLGIRGKANTLRILPSRCSGRVECQN